MADRQSVAMYTMHSDSPRDEEARAALAEALPEGAEVGEADDVGVFEVTVDADDLEGALEVVWDAVAAAGVDDHILFLEHPDLPEHWRPRSGSP